MKLRELINRLEHLSRNGKNDNMTVEAVSCDGMYEVSVLDASVGRFVTENDEYEYIKIETE